MTDFTASWQWRTIVTLCGSTRFKDEFMRMAKRHTLQGDIVLMPHVFTGSGDIIGDGMKRILDDLHKEKIAMSDYIVVINKGGYIGDSTKSEIEFAESMNKPIVYMEECDEQ